MHDLNDLFYFAKVVEAGGFAAAGRILGIPKSRLSRRIAELENRLGARLLQRTTRNLALTEVGERYLRHCQAMLQEAEQAEETVTSLTSEPRGRLRVSAPGGIALLTELVVSFLAAYPKVQLELIQTSRRIDLLNEGVDVALRVRSAEDEDPTLITRRLRPAQAFLVAAPALLENAEIRTPEDLARLPALGALEADRHIHMRFEHVSGRSQDVVLAARLAVVDFEVRKQAALAGLGFTLLPAPLCLNELADGRLIRLLPDWALPTGNLQAVYTHRRGMLPAVRAWIEHLSEAVSRGNNRSSGLKRATQPSTTGRQATASQSIPPGVQAQSTRTPTGRMPCASCVGNTAAPPTRPAIHRAARTHAEHFPACASDQPGRWICRASTAQS